MDPYLLAVALTPLTLALADLLGMELGVGISPCSSLLMVAVVASTVIRFDSLGIAFLNVDSPFFWSLALVPLAHVLTVFALLAFATFASSRSAHA